MNKIIAPTKVVNDPEIYFTNDKGIISKNYQSMAADKTMRQELINKHSINTPAPNKYQATNHSGNEPIRIHDFKANSHQRIRSQAKWHQMISTVPSIPDKTQVFFIAEDEEDYDQGCENPSNLLSQNRIPLTEQIVFDDFKEPTMNLNLDVQPYLEIPRATNTKISNGTIEQPITIQQETVTNMTNKQQIAFSNLDSHSTGVPATYRIEPKNVSKVFKVK